VRTSRAAAWALVLPGLIPLLVFVVAPALQSVWLSLHESAPFSAHLTWVGLDNYRQLFSSPEYWRVYAPPFSLLWRR
jgi:ABC-type sugar transport system permease subunit